MFNNIVLIAAALILIMNVIAFALMYIDKQKAKAGQWRIKEATLFLATALFGGLGGTLGMFLFRHKTKHWYFRLGFPALLAVQVVLIVIGVSLLA